MFADLLRLELRGTVPGEVPALHAVAAGWFAGHGYPVEAVRHARASGEAERYLARAARGVEGDEGLAPVRAQRRGRFQVMLTVLRLFLARQRGDLRAVVGEAAAARPRWGLGRRPARAGPLRGRAG
jgi:LuxR family maltose regulon positive regulatory protein